MLLYLSALSKGQQCLVAVMKVKCILATTHVNSTISVLGETLVVQLESKTDLQFFSITNVLLCHFASFSESKFDVLWNVCSLSRLQYVAPLLVVLPPILPRL